MANYLYNGVELPALPEWDKETYPYAAIFYNDLVSKTILFVRNIPTVVYNSVNNRSAIGVVTRATGYNFELIDGAWGLSDDMTDANETGSHGIYGQILGSEIWANHNVLYTTDFREPELAGTIYLPASYPIDPETGEEIRIYDPIPVGSAPEVEPKAFMLGYLTGQKVRVLRRKLTNTEDITDAELIDGVLYIRNANAKQLNDILEVT